MNFFCILHKTTQLLGLLLLLLLLLALLARRLEQLLVLLLGLDEGVLEAVGV